MRLRLAPKNRLCPEGALVSARTIVGTGGPTSSVSLNLSTGRGAAGGRFCGPARWVKHRQSLHFSSAAAARNLIEPSLGIYGCPLDEKPRRAVVFFFFSPPPIHVFLFAHKKKEACIFIHNPSPPVDEGPSGPGIRAALMAFLTGIQFAGSRLLQSVPAPAVYFLC